MDIQHVCKQNMHIIHGHVHILYDLYITNMLQHMH